jgi:hypothetical protein
LKLQAPDGKQRVTDCANTEGLFRCDEVKKGDIPLASESCRKGRKNQYQLSTCVKIGLHTRPVVV